MALTQMCTPRGGIETDVTVALVAPGRYYVVSAAATETHDLAWIERHAPDDGSAHIENVTLALRRAHDRRARARASCSSASRATTSRTRASRSSARATSRSAAAASLAVRVSYVGELGWELHHPIEQQGALYELLAEAGEDLGLVDFGYRALESMRFEKCYRLWGADMSADWSPLQAGLGRFVAFDKGDFIGRDALLREREQGSTHALACLVVDADGVDAHGLEPVYAGGERPVAYVASGGYGHTIERSIALAYLPVEHAARGHRADRRHPRRPPPRRRQPSSRCSTRRASGCSPRTGLVGPRRARARARRVGGSSSARATSRRGRRSRGRRWRRPRRDPRRTPARRS